MRQMKTTLDQLHLGIERGIHPGFQLYVSLGGGIVVQDACGVAHDDVAMTSDTLTLWMSAGKPIAAVAVLQLVQQGLMSLETPVAEVIPEFGVNEKSAITLRHILTHTAGFRGPLNNFTPGTFQEIVDRVCSLKQEPGWTPGEKAGYHIGSSWFMLGAVVQRLTGMAFDDYVRRHVFLPLDIHDAFVGMSDAEYDANVDRFATMYVTEKGSPDDNWPGNARGANTVARPGANARGPIRALARVYESLLHDDRLLDVEWRTQLRTRHRVGMLDQTFKQTLDWGLGVMIDSKQYAGEHQYGFGPHASAESFGHSGNQSSCAFADPKHDLVVAWACNGMPGETRHQARASDINRAIYEDLGLA
jgi:CubicO group peptidase (beta-lactamase class C family)